ncbi:hypothetical protein SAMN05661093_09293 [Kibdelosporangium aridum]|uniref:Endonuclease/exonuclease/phosphatase domain-containing protein n=2 Tax=Kibdelosporangium aridum TaxID=2030 RepID=A0A1W2FVE5_KIBAR|nr:hypothetical protein SAMN05661093_09293 [Kibdelosporangium aridum]
MTGKRVFMAAVVAVLAGGAVVAPPAAATGLRIHDIQKPAHLSPLNGQSVTDVPGVVTALTSTGFWFEDPQRDNNPATSEGLFVRTGTQPTVATGDAVTVTGAVQEFRPNNIEANLTTTQIVNPAIRVVSSGNPLPVTVIGHDRRPPKSVIKEGTNGDVETSGTFDPAKNGLDFWESLEGMRLRLDDPVAVGPTSPFGEIPVLARDGAGAGERTRRGGIVVRPTDLNPERIMLDPTIAATPKVNVGDHFAGPVIGVLDYNFNNFKLVVTASPVRVADGPAKEITRASRRDELAIATLNSENLSATNPQADFDKLAAVIVHNLRSPDLINVEELQDNSGGADDGTVADDQTVARLTAAISAAGGPAYQWRAVFPQDKADGAWAEGNIRVGFLFRTDRGLNFVDRPGADATTPTAVTNVGGKPQLTLSPGRIDPNNPAFINNRKPLVGEFTWCGKRVFVIANHWISKGGVASRYPAEGASLASAWDVDQPLFGRYQPPALITENQRVAQATIVADFVRQIQAIDPDAYVVVAGDLNDFPWSPPLQALTSRTGMKDLPAHLPLPERYTYVLDGNSQVLDHILLSGSMFARPHDFDVVHVNSEFVEQTSDHDPTLVRVDMH